MCLAIRKHQYNNEIKEMIELNSYEKYKEFKDYVENEIFIKEKLWRTTNTVFNEETGVINMGDCSEDDAQLDLKYICNDCDLEFEVEKFSKKELIELVKTHFEERHKIKEIIINKKEGSG